MSLSHAVKENSISSKDIFKNLLDSVNALQKKTNHLLFNA